MSELLDMEQAVSAMLNDMRMPAPPSELEARLMVSMVAGVRAGRECVTGEKSQENREIFASLMAYAATADRNSLERLFADRYPGHRFTE